MNMIFLGTGSAFTVGSANYHSNMLLENAQGQRLLIDCGTDARHALHELDLSYRDIESVYVSHLHADHAGGLEWLGFTRKFDQNCNNPTLYISEKLVNDLWDKVLSGGMSSLRGMVANLSSYFNVNAIAEADSFNWHGLTIKTIPTLHVISGNTTVPSYGVLFSLNGVTVFITTDTQFCPNLLMKYYQLADIIFHDCETAPIKSGVHSHFTDLITLDSSIKNKMWLYHYNPGELPDAKKHGFSGFVKKGQRFDFG